MTSTVNVLCPNGRRQNVKVNANTRILQIIETVCAKQGFDPKEHNLKHQRSVVDAQLPVRYANLPNNAKLELVKSDSVRKESPTQLALQLASGDRLQHSFAPSSTLWDVLGHWEDQPASVHKGQLMSARPGEDGELLHPVCIYLRQEIIGQAALQSTTLHSLGLVGGKALVRLIHRAADISAIPAQTSETKTVPTSAVTVEPTTVSSSHSDMDKSTANKGGDNVSQQGKDTQMDVDSSSSKLSVATKTSGGGSNQSGTSVTPMDVDVSSSSEGLSSSDGKAKEMGARPKESDPPITLTKEQEQLANEMGAAMAQAIMQHRGGGGGASSSSSSFVPQPSPFANFKFPSVPLSGSKESDQHQTTVKPCDRLPIVYNTSASLPEEAQVGDVPEEFFDVTVSDVRKMYSDLRTQSARMGEQGLETKAMREARELREMQRYPKVVVRIHFPDKLILQGFFRPQEKVEAVSEFVKSHLGDSSDKFYLYTTPPKTVLKDQNRPCMLLNYVQQQLFTLERHHRMIIIYQRAP
ncbi:tether containing UBX domain for GLUT4-like [Amphiura filiformis]|uniref:tether containing UBX domain for GLUT4-like n=1 Tax=Amphiura filiformis TaxID=82378 RepID=UPI003B21D2D2